MPNAKAYSYLRFSTPEQMQGDSHRRQHQLSLDYCRAHGLTLDTEVTYSDLGVSAFRGKNAEDGRLAEFLEAVRVGIVAPGSFLLVESLDRISRQAARRALRILESICDEGVTVVTLCDGRTYTREALDTDPTALIMSLLIFIRANEESELKSKRAKATWVGKRLRVETEGHKLTAKCPGWLKLNKAKNKWVVIEARAKVVRWMFAEAARGVSPQDIAAALNDEGTPVFGSGSKWHRSYVLKILFQHPGAAGTFVPRVLEFVNGKRVWRNLAPVENYFPTIVDPEVYRRVQAFRENWTWCPPRAARHNIFAGLVRCARCGGSMTLQTKGRVAHGARYFVCVAARYGKGCKYTAVRYGNVEDAFIKAAPEILRCIAPSLGAGPGFTSERAAELLRLLKAKTMDRPSTHEAVRAFFGGLSLDPDAGTATLGWRHGEASRFQFASGRP